jgi:hypothetical protein
VPDSPLGELLASTVPEPPVSIDASSVLGRARRRARLRVSTLVAVASAGVVALSFLASSLRDSSTPVAPVATKPPGPQPSAGAPTAGPAPNVVGLAVDAAMSALTQAECMGRVGAIVNDSTAPVGQVLAQRTTSDLCEVALTVSAGSKSSAPPCRSLAITAGVGGVGLGHAGFPLHFRNDGPAACALSGYPTVTATDSETRKTVTARHTPSGYLGGTDLALPTYLLRPGDEVSALVEGTDVPPGNATSCPELAQVRVTVNGRTTPVTQTLSDCSGMEVHPYVPGTTGSAH